MQQRYLPPIMEQICPPAPYTHKTIYDYDYDVQKKKTERERNLSNIKVPVDTNFHRSLNVLGKRIQLPEVWV